MFYEQSLSKSEIARKTNLSVTHVNRLLREGLRAGVVEIRVKPHTVQSLESDLIKVFGLRDARVVTSSANTDSTRIDLGSATATLFEELVSDGAKVGIGSGRTLFEMASKLQERPREISICPANLVLEQDLQIAGLTANTVSTIVWFRSRPSAKACRLEMFFPSTDNKILMNYVNQLSRTSALASLREQIRKLDVYFLGASEFRLNSRLSRLRNDLIGKTEKAAIVGDVAFNMLDASGREVDFNLDEVLVRLSADALKKLAASKRKTVVLAAGGREKAGVVSAALAARVCNVLVTDSDVAEEVLKNMNT